MSQFLTPLENKVCECFNKPYELLDVPSDDNSTKDNVQVPLIEFCETCKDFACNCFLKCPTPDCENNYNIYEDVECYECLSDKISICECGKEFHIDEPYGMCLECEMKERRQESIDKIQYPDDVDRN
jgi:hypothetical protein